MSIHAAKANKIVKWDAGAGLAGVSIEKLERRSVQLLRDSEFDTNCFSFNWSCLDNAGLGLSVAPVLTLPASAGTFGTQVSQSWASLGLSAAFLPYTFDVTVDIESLGPTGVVNVYVNDWDLTSFNTLGETTQRIVITSIQAGRLAVYNEDAIGQPHAIVNSIKLYLVEQAPESATIVDVYENSGDSNILHYDLTWPNPVVDRDVVNLVYDDVAGEYYAQDDIFSGERSPDAQFSAACDPSGFTGWTCAGNTSKIANGVCTLAATGLNYSDSFNASYVRMGLAPNDVIEINCVIRSLDPGSEVNVYYDNNLLQAKFDQVGVNTPQRVTIPASPFQSTFAIYNEGPNGSGDAIIDMLSVRIITLGAVEPMASQTLSLINCETLKPELDVAIIETPLQSNPDILPFVRRDMEYDSATTASSINEYQIQSLEVAEIDITFVSLDVAIATVDQTGQVTWVSNGLSKIEYSSPGFQTIVFERTITDAGSGVTTYTPLQFSAGTMGEHIQAQMTALIGADVPGDAVQKFWASNTGGITPVAAMNPNFFAGSLDFTASSMSSSFNKVPAEMFSAALISDRHAITATHVWGSIGLGAQYVYQDPDGSTQEILTITAAHIVPHNDLILLYFDKAISLNVTPYKILPQEWVDDYAPACSLVGLPSPPWPNSRLPLLRKAVHNLLDARMSYMQIAYCSSQSSTLTPTSKVMGIGGQPPFSPLDGWGVGAEPGDSGSPSFFLINGELVLISTTTNSGGPDIGFSGPELDAAMNSMADAGDPNKGSYAVQTVDLSMFTVPGLNLVGGQIGTGGWLCSASTCTHTGTSPSNLFTLLNTGQLVEGVAYEVRVNKSDPGNMTIQVGGSGGVSNSQVVSGTGLKIVTLVCEDLAETDAVVFNSAIDGEVVDYINIRTPT